MEVYTCNMCLFTTTLAFNYKRHLETKRHITNASKYSTPIIKCNYCDKTYKHKSSLSKHVKYNCIKNKDEDFKELARLLNLQKAEQDKKHREIEKKIKKLQSEPKKAQIQKLTTKLQINGGIHIQNNIQLLAYRDTDVSHLTDKDYIACIKKIN